MTCRGFAWLSLLLAPLVGCDAPLTNAGFNDAGVPVDAGVDAGETCPPGQYKTAPPWWDGPFLLWTGQNDGQAPPCPGPPASGGEAWTGYADLVPPPACGPCACAPSTGTCELSSTLTAHDVLCQDLGQKHKSISFDATGSWSGKCDTSSQIPEGVTKSVTIEPVAVSQEACAPLVPVAAPPHAMKVPTSAWRVFARSCYGWNWKVQENPETVCIPSDYQLPDGFHICVAHEDAQDCRSPDWPDRYVFYETAEDERECTKCTCGPPVGGMCTAMVSLDKDPACTAPVAPGVGISSAMPTCIDINPPGPPLVSKFATPPTYIPGTCEPGRIEVHGTVAKTGAKTFCCQR